MKKLLYLLIFFTQILLGQGWVSPGGGGLLIWENNGWIWATGPGIVNDLTFFVKTHDISNCILHLSTTKKDFSDGDTIQTWADNSYYENDASQGDPDLAPVYDLTTDTGSLVFDGVDNWLDLPDKEFINNEFSISFWMYLTSDDFYFIMNLSKTNLISIFTLGTKISIQDNSGAAIRQTTAINFIDVWTHFVFIGNYSTGYASYNLYINGVNKAMNAAGNSEANGTNRIGSRGNGAYPFIGKLDDIMFFSKVLSQPEIDSLYANKVQAVRLINIE